MCNCIKKVEQKFKDNFGYEEVNGPVELLSSRAYLSFEVKEAGKKKSKQVPMMLSKCPICGKEYANKEENSKPIIPDDNPWIPIGTTFPEENQKVWVTNEYHGGSRRVEESVYKNNEFHETGYLNRDIVSTDLVKAWCPRFVPEPYKEVSEE